jgi:hypothetical protein|nr:MAG TPA: transmembrane protein [Crassvirales sp.]
MSTRVYVKGGVGFPTLLSLLFIALKLCKVITWSWWWVLAPLWIYVALFILIALFISILLIIAQNRRC